ncbi:MAG: hypothetical protein PHE15_07210, partial [Dehalococcoidales bacterium]|nr:hypothetical protein [Dehalococcoidales bacterium]
MSEKKGWHEAYIELIRFITKYSEIKIGEKEIYISEKIRPDFYKYFNNVRTTFLKEFPILLKEAEALSENYIEVEHEVKNMIKTDNILMEPRLNNFLHDPVSGATKVLFDLLFDLLKGKISTKIFEQKALSNLEINLRNLLHLGYARWVVLSSIKLLEPNKIFHVTIHEANDREMTNMSDTSKYPVPLPEESEGLSFEYHPNPILTVPDFIIHS